MGHSHAHDGLLELGGFAAYRSESVEPISTDYHGVRVCEIPPNGQGITALMTLNILEQADLRGMAHLSADHLHMVIEAFKLAWAERDEYVADPAFNRFPVEEMLSKEFAARQYARIDSQRAAPYPVQPAARAHRDTVYRVWWTATATPCPSSTVYYPFGSGVVAGDTGDMLQNRGAGFVLEPGHFNCIAPAQAPAAYHHSGDGLSRR